ncbi:SMP-30/gluconolactonase/LRE family protein [Actinomadura graeca]|nr:superoxide dismutase [Actinomadura graeca]
MWYRLLITALTTGLVLPLGGSALGAAEPLPDRIPLPAGFQPEGIAAGPDGQAFLGSRATGAIYRVDLRTGKGEVISQPVGKPSLGMKIGKDRLYVAGGNSGTARVYDTHNGALLKTYTLTTATAFINDVTLTEDAAFLTDSTNPTLYKVPLTGDGEATKLPLTGDIVYQTGFNANGITTTPDRKSLVLIQSNTGKLFKVDPATGATKTVDLHGETLTAGDGILRDGRTLYAVQNRLNTVAVFELSEDGGEGKLVKRVTDPKFDVPTTVAKFGERIYLPNARFNTTPTPETPYDVIGVQP